MLLEVSYCLRESTMLVSVLTLYHLNLCPEHSSHVGSVFYVPHTQPVLGPVESQGILIQCKWPLLLLSAKEGKPLPWSSAVPVDRKVCVTRHLQEQLCPCLKNTLKDVMYRSTEQVITL